MHLKGTGDVEIWSGYRVPQVPNAFQYEPRPTRLIPLMSGAWCRSQREVWEDSLDPSAFGPHLLEWAAFGYSGHRTLQFANIRELKDPTGPPLAGSLAFGLASEQDSLRLSSWLASQQFKALKATAAGDTTAAQRYGESLRRIEAAVRELTETEFALHFAVHDLNVRARLNGTVVDLDLMPDGVKSVLSWVADLLMKMDAVRWIDDLPIHEREFLLLLDEMDVHLHPSWQRKLLPVIQRLFPKAQIIATTHSPFVVASLRDGAVIELVLDEKRNAVAKEPVRAPFFKSYSQTMASLFGISTDFDLETEQELTAFREAGAQVRPGDSAGWSNFENRGRALAAKSEELSAIVRFELNQVRRRGGLTGS
jgi:hypothetical protein